jgi:hypothetical protein
MNKRDTGRAMRVSFSKRTLAPGWAEVCFVMQRAIPDSPDIALVGDEARTKGAQYVLAFAAGLAHTMGEADLDARLWALAERLKNQ